MGFNLFKKMTPEELEVHKRQQEENIKMIKQGWTGMKAVFKGMTVEQYEAEKEYVQQIKSGSNMPTVPVPEGTILKKNEICHLAGESFYTVEKSSEIGFAGARIKVTNNISLNTGSGRKITHEVKVKGYSVITNQRFMFIPYGNEKGFNINLSKIESYQIYKDGLLIRTATKNYIVIFEKKNMIAVEPVFIGALANIS